MIEKFRNGLAYMKSGNCKWQKNHCKICNSICFPVFSTLNDEGVTYDLKAFLIVLLALQQIFMLADL